VRVLPAPSVVTNFVFSKAFKPHASVELANVLMVVGPPPVNGNRWHLLHSSRLPASSHIGLREYPLNAPSYRE
jgi:hypothetical protein